MPAFCANRFAELALEQRHCVSRIAPLRLWVAEQRNEAVSFVALWSRQPAEFQERRIHIQQLHRTLTDLSLRAGQRDDQRRAQADFEERIRFRPLSFFPKVITMIAPKDDDRLVTQLQAIEFGEHAANLLVNKAGRGIVSADHLARFGGRSIS